MQFVSRKNDEEGTKNQPERWIRNCICKYDNKISPESNETKIMDASSIWGVDLTEGNRPNRKAILHFMRIP